MLSTQENAHRAHNTRAEAYCHEIAASLGLSSVNTRRLKHAITESSHLNLKSLKPGLSRMKEHLGLDVLEEPASSRLVSELDRIAELVRIFDQELEFSAYTDTLLEDQLGAINSDVEGNPAVKFVLPKLRRSSKEDLIRLIPKLPVFPGNILELLRELRDGNPSIRKLVEFASRDQVFAGNLISCANSAAYSSARELTNLGHAVAYIGTERAAMILTALAMKPFIVGSGTVDLWRHALEAAAAAEELSKHCNLPNTDSFLLGLMHDIGRLLLNIAPPHVNAARKRLEKNGCESQIAELLVCGTDHAGAGALVLDHWNFPLSFVEAVRFHHEPQATDSKLAALLYVVEFWAESNEDPASQVRLSIALERLGLSQDFVTQMRLKRPPMPLA